MSKLEELKELRQKIDCGECNINDLKKHMIKLTQNKK